MNRGTLTRSKAVLFAGAAAIVHGVGGAVLGAFVDPELLGSAASNRILWAPWFVLPWQLGLALCALEAVAGVLLLFERSSARRLLLLLSAAGFSVRLLALGLALLLLVVGNTSASATAHATRSGSPETFLDALGYFVLTSSHAAIWVLCRRPEVVAALRQRAELRPMRALD